jgi:hypothetical protein
VDPPVVDSIPVGVPTGKVLTAMRDLGPAAHVERCLDTIVELHESGQRVRLVITACAGQRGSGAPSGCQSPSSTFLGFVSGHSDVPSCSLRPICCSHGMLGHCCIKRSAYWSWSSCWRRCGRQALRCLVSHNLQGPEGVRSRCGAWRGRPSP